MSADCPDITSNARTAGWHGSAAVTVSAITGATPPALLVVREQGGVIAWVRTNSAGAGAIEALRADVTYELTALIAGKHPQTRLVTAA